MSRSLRHLKWGLILAGFVLIAFPLPASISPWFTLIIILITGLPHGAIDHVLYSTSNTGSPRAVTFRFYAEYFIWMGAYGALWWVAPKLALLAFLLVSAYHFGQTQLAYVRKDDTSRPLYLLWGGLVLAGLTLSQTIVPDFGLSQIVQLPAMNELRLMSRPYVELGACLAIVGLVYLLHNRSHDLLLELIELMVLSLVFLSNDFYTSFGLFFGGWHALNAIHHSLEDVSKFKRFNLLKFIWAALPHSIASTGGIVLLVYLTSQYAPAATSEKVLFISISILALPHIIVLEGWYSFLQRKHPAPVADNTAVSIKASQLSRGA